MICNIKKNKVIRTLQATSFILLATLTFDARAEYYMVYPGSGCDFQCGTTYQTTVVEMRFVSPRAHYSVGSGEMSEYAWVPKPEPVDTGTLRDPNCE